MRTLQKCGECTLYTVLFVHRTVYTVHCTVYSVNRTLLCVHFKSEANVHCTMYSIHRTVYTVHCTVYTVVAHTLLSKQKPI